MLLQVGTARDRLYMRVRMKLLQGVVEKLRPLEPPMPEQFGVIHSDDNRGSVLLRFCRSSRLVHQLGEVLGMNMHSAPRQIRLIELLGPKIILWTGDAPIAQVARIVLFVKLKIELISRIAVSAAPNLNAGFGIARKAGHRLHRESAAVDPIGRIGRTIR